MLRTVKLPASINILSEINNIIGQALPGTQDQLIMKTQLVVEELLSNICNYAYDGTQGSATFACGIVNFDGEQSIMIQLTDEGKPYDPFTETTSPDIDATLDERPLGGLGVFLVKEIANHYLYMRIDNQNQTQIIIKTGA